MPNNSKSKLKLLYLKRILEEETDAEHGLTMTELLERLNDYDIPAERKSIYRDIDTLREFGMGIQTLDRNPVQYAVIKRDFSLSELMLLVDAVETCKSLTKRQSNMLVTNLKLLASDSERELLNRHIHVTGQITSKSDCVFGCVDTLHEAMRKGVQVNFKYMKYNVRGERKATRNGMPYEVTPVGITYTDGFYYLTAWNDEAGNLWEFRIDRIESLGLSQNRATRNETISHYKYDGDDFESFGRFNGDPVIATLLVNADKVEIIMDRFGDAANLYEHDENTAKAHVKVHKSEQFFGWIAGLGGTIKIDGPAHLLNDYKKFLTTAINIAG